ncbi:MAG: hypothetical protein KAU50_08960 [Candidatus Marinimicrobia bacterium]|nr:hypothetical protein [Candidatus Neomarinimicrobiota bacterium]
MKYLSMVTLLGLGALFVSCDEVADNINEADILAALEELVAADEVFSIDGLSDDGLFDDDYDQSEVLGKALADTLWPRDYAGFRWGLRVTDRSVLIDFDNIGADTIYATITGTITGLFRSGGWQFGVDSVRVITDTLTKQFTMVTTRRAYFINTGDTGDPRKDWKIKGLTAVLGTVGSNVSLDRLSFSLSDDSTTYFALDKSEVLTRFFNRENLPRFRDRLPVRVLADISNMEPMLPVASGEMVVLRHGRGMAGFSRRRINDLGLYADEVALDDTFSGWWKPRGMPDQPHVHRLHAEVIDLRSLLVADEDLHLEFIGLPYRIGTGVQEPPF